MSGRCVGNPPESLWVEEHEAMKSMTSTARDAVAMSAARCQGRKIMARMLARHSRCATMRLHACEMLAGSWFLDADSALSRIERPAAFANMSHIAVTGRRAATFIVCRSIHKPERIQN
jgi:hypothetical protein